MNFRTLILILSSLISLNSFSQQTNEPIDGEIISKEENYLQFCSDLKTFVYWLNPNTTQAQFQSLTPSNIQELNSLRKPYLDILKFGKPKIDELIATTDSSEFGGSFYATVACGVIDSLKDLIKEKGCINLETKEKLSGEPGIQACNDFSADPN